MIISVDEHLEEEEAEELAGAVPLRFVMSSPEAVVESLIGSARPVFARDPTRLHPAV